MQQVLKMAYSIFKKDSYKAHHYGMKSWLFLEKN
jgi:hypothetical protein